MSRLVRAQHEGNTRHPFASNQADLNLQIALICNDGDNSGFRKANFVDGFIGLFEMVALRKFPSDEARLKQPQVGGS
jgi:hypothetical protein